MDKHIVWSGELYYKKAEYHINDQVVTDSLWAVLMRESVHGPKRLELYHRYTDYTNGHPPRFVLDLSDMLHVERVLDSTSNQLQSKSRSCGSSLLHKNLQRSRWDAERPAPRSSFIRPPRQQHHFTITTEKETHILAARTGDESSFWVGKLNELLHGPPERGVEYEFPVSVLPTSLSKDFELIGNHVFKVTETEIQLYDASGDVPTTFVCPLENIERVDVTINGAGSKKISLLCTNVCGATGTVTLSTNSSADISRVLNHRRMTTVASDRPAALHLQQRDSSQRQQQQQHYLHSMSADLAGDHSPTVQRTLFQYRRSTCSDLCKKTPPPSSQRTRDLLPSSSISDFGKHSPTPSLRHRYGNHPPPPNVHASVAMAPQPSGGISRKDRGVALSEITSSSDSEQDDETASVFLRKISGGDFESVASWFGKKDEYGNSGDFSRIQSTPNIQALQHPKVFKRSSSEEELLKNKCRPSSLIQRNRLSRFSSVGSNIEEEPVDFETAASPSKRGGEPQSLVSNESYEHYDINSWRTQPTVTNGNDTVQTPSSSHDYESIKEQNFESLHDYDLVKDFERQHQSLPDYEDIKEGNYSLVGAGESRSDYEDIDESILGERLKSGELGNTTAASHKLLKRQESLSDYEDISESLVGEHLEREERLGDGTTHKLKQEQQQSDYEDLQEAGYSLAGKLLINPNVEGEGEEEEEGDLEDKTSDYDYVKFRILGVRLRGIPGQQPHPSSREPSDSDEEEHYYY